MVSNIEYNSGTITYRQGTTAALVIRIKSSPTTVITPTGYTAVLEVQKDYATKINDCRLNGEISGDTIIFHFVPASLSGVRITEDESSRVYQIKITSDTGSVSIPLSGEFILEKDLT